MVAAAVRVTLAGRCLPHNENLGLAYLRAALEHAGVAVTTCFVNDAADLARAVASVLATRPHVVGLSLADGGSAVLPLALGEALGRAGFRGHVTAGGQFATLARAWLLERYAWLDSVVRFAGEVPLVALAERVERGEPVAGVPGVTTRAGDGAPAPVTDRTPIDLRPHRHVLPEILGHKAAHITASRGCRGRCQYCGPAALQTLERQEGAAAGISRRVLSAGGVGGVRRRALAAVCDEMAELYHAHDVRYFYFVDEHLLPYREDEALALLARWRRLLAARRVGPIGIGAMLRADRLTPAIVRAFAEVGLVRAFVGLELATAAEARRFGRRAPAEPELGVIRACAEAGVATVSNLMLVHPYSTPSTVAAGLELLDRVPGGVLEATRMMVYHGTELCDRMRAEGRLAGNPLRYAYAFADPTMSRFAEIFTRLRGEAFWDYSIAYRTHDAYLAFALARRLDPARRLGETGRRLAAARATVNTLYLAGYRKGLALALAGGGFAEAGALVAELRPAVGALERALERIEAEVLAAAPARTRMFAPMRAAAAGVFAFSLCSASLQCGGKAVVDPSQGGAGAGGGPTTSGTTTSSTTTSCVPTEPTEANIAAALATGAACFSGNVTFEPAAAAVVDFNAYAYGEGMLSLMSCYTPPAEQAAAALESTAKQALAAACLEKSSSSVYAWIEGGATSDLQKMLLAINAACSDAAAWYELPQFQIVLDQGGKVVAVNADPSLNVLADCILGALQGLTFPCLAGFEICPEYAIAE